MRKDENIYILYSSIRDHENELEVIEIFMGKSISIRIQWILKNNSFLESTDKQ